MKKYICTGCKSVFYEGNVPTKCPVCACDAGFFKVTTASDDEVKALAAEKVKQNQLEPQSNVYNENVSSSMPASGPKGKKYKFVWLLVGFIVVFYIAGFAILFIAGSKGGGDKTTSTVYTTSKGLEIVLYDSGFARFGDYEGKWDNTGYFTMGNNGISFIYVTSPDGRNVYCSICRDALYWGGRSTVISNYPHGEPLTKQRR